MAGVVSEQVKCYGDGCANCTAGNPPREAQQVAIRAACLVMLGQEKREATGPNIDIFVGVCGGVGPRRLCSNVGRAVTDSI